MYALLTACVSELDAYSPYLLRSKGTSKRILANLITPLDLTNLVLFLSQGPQPLPTPQLQQVL